MGLIALNGKISVGKDLVGKIIQYLVAENKSKHELYYSIEEFLSGEDVYNINYTKDYEESISDDSGWKIRKFADKLKDIVCLLIGCTREQLEDRSFKEAELGEEWWYWENSFGKRINYLDNIIYGSTAKDGLTSRKLIKLTPRLLLQLIGTECGRNIIHPNIWVNSLFSEYKNKWSNLNLARINNNEITGEEYPNWIITDMRFPNEYQAVKQRGGITIRVNRYNSTCVCVDDSSLDCLTPCSRKPQHESEVALDHVTDWDYVIDNSGTIEELVEKVRTILVNEKII